MIFILPIAWLLVGLIGLAVVSIAISSMRKLSHANPFKAVC